jgi:outer membrane protein assembly factor BamD
MLFTIGTLAQNEVHIARYYFKRGAYMAAINRAQSAITDYREVPALEEALYIVFRSYDALGMTALRDDAKRILDKNFPQSIFLARGFKGDSDPWWKVW